MSYMCVALHSKKVSFYAGTQYHGRIDNLLHRRGFLSNAAYTQEETPQQQWQQWKQLPRW